MFASVLHLGPRDTDRLTVLEFDTLARWLDDYQRQIEAANRG